MDDATAADSGAGLDYGTMMSLLQAAPGRRATRALWGRKFFLINVPGSTFEVESHRPVGLALPWLVGGIIQYRPHVDLFDVVASSLGTWNPTFADECATDWIVESSEQ